MRPLQFYYNDGDPERVRQFDAPRARVVSCEPEVVFNATLVRLPQRFDVPVPAGYADLELLNGRDHELVALRPDIELATRLKVRAPLELLVLQNALALIEQGQFPVACLVEHYVRERQELVVYERSVPLYNLPGAQLALTISSRENLRTTLLRGTSTVIEPPARAAIERHYFGAGLRSLYAELLHAAKHAFDSSVTITEQQLSAVTLDVSSTSNGYQVQDGRLSMELQLDTLTQGAALHVGGADLAEPSRAAQELLRDLLVRERVGALYFSASVVLDPELFDVTREVWPSCWPLFRRLGLTGDFRRLGLTGDVRAARLVSGKVPPRSGRRPAPAG